MTVAELKEIETKISHLKKIQSDFFNKKKADRTEADTEALRNARQELNELKAKAKKGYRLVQKAKQSTVTAN